MILFLQLYFNFFATGLFAVGGGMAAIPFLYDISDRTGWFTYQELGDMIAVSECTPGAIGANMGTYAGFTLSGVPGAVTAVLGLITPGILIILVIAKFLTKYHEKPAVQNAFRGLKPATAALILLAAITMIKVSIVHIENFSISDLSTIAQTVDVKALLLAAVIFAVSRIFRKIHPIVLIAASAAAGIVFSFT